MSKYMVFDCETGGIDPNKCSILTLYAQVLDSNFNKLDEIELFIKPNDDIYQVTAEALAINKIDLKKHNEIAVTDSHAAMLFLEFIKAHSNTGKEKLIPVGHNVKYDIDMVTAKLIKKLTFEMFVSYRHIDTGVIGRYLQLVGKLPQTLGGSLSSFAKHFELNTDKAHDAKGDVDMTVEILKRFLGM